MYMLKLWSVWLIVLICQCPPTVRLLADDSGESKTALEAKGCFIRTDADGSVHTVSAGPALDDADLGRIARFAKLKVLDLGHNPITDEGLRQISQIQGLERIRAGGTRITDKSMNVIGNWKSLRAVALPESVTDAGIRQLPDGLNLEYFSAGGPGVTNAAIEKLLTFRGLQTVGLYGKVTSAGFERLAQLKHIEYIIMREWMDDAMMPVFAKFPRLKQLSLNAIPVSEAELGHLRGMRNLYTLTLPKNMSDAGLMNVASLPRLAQLDLRFTSVTNEGLDALKDLKTLSMLTLPATTSDDAVVKLAGFHLRLSSLNVFGAGYTDACIPSLISMQNLNQVGLWKTAITEEGFQQLQQARPSLRLSR